MFRHIFKDFLIPQAELPNPQFKQIKIRKNGLNVTPLLTNKKNQRKTPCFLLLILISKKNYLLASSLVNFCFNVFNISRIISKTLIPLAITSGIFFRKNHKIFLQNCCSRTSHGSFLLLLFPTPLP